MRALQLFVCAIVLAGVVAVEASNDPQQLRIAFAGANSEGITMTWVTASAAASTVQYGTSVSDLSLTATGSSSTYKFLNYKSGFIHHVSITSNMKPATMYYYRVGDATQGWSPVQSFTSAPVAGPNSPVKLALVGDLGQTVHSNSTIAHFAADLDLTGLLLVGDLAYADSFEPRWDSWGRITSHVAHSLPWMIAAGNHEVESVTSVDECVTAMCDVLRRSCEADWLGGCASALDCAKKCSHDDWSCKFKCLETKNPDTVTKELLACQQENLPGCQANTTFPPEFLAYNSRFRMPFAETGGVNNEWYSFNLGLAHFIILNKYADWSAGSPQYEWLMADLAAVDRSVTPWLFVTFHCPWYNSNWDHQGEGYEMMHTLEDTLNKYRVDAVFSGHVHAYERTTPVYHNSTCAPGAAPTYFIVGDGGNREGLAMDYMQPAPAWSAFRQASYGHSTLEIVNSSHALWNWHRDEDPDTTFADSHWILHDASVQPCAA